MFPLDMRGCICHFVKCQIHPFISKGPTFWNFRRNFQLYMTSIVSIVETYTPKLNYLTNFYFITNYFINFSVIYFLWSLPGIISIQVKLWAHKGYIIPLTSGEGRGAMVRAWRSADVAACRAVSNPAWCRIFREISYFSRLNLGTLLRWRVLGQDN